MPVVACPSCGERGKIPPTLVGSRIKCKKCGVAFNVAAPAAKAAAAELTPTVPAMPVSSEEGIVVEGLDASAWTSAAETSSDQLRAVAVAETAEPEAPNGQSFDRQRGEGTREYKILCSRDKIFEGKFDLPRLEEVLNHYARQGWVVKAMTTPHLKSFGDALKEEIVVLLER